MGNRASLHQGMLETGNPDKEEGTIFQDACNLQWVMSGGFKMHLQHPCCNRDSVLLSMLYS